MMMFPKTVTFQLKAEAARHVCRGLSQLHCQREEVTASFLSDCCTP